MAILKRHILIIIIIIIASLLRFIGTNPGYNRYHNDEPIVYGTAIEMVENNSLDPGRFDYPGGSIYINYVFFKFIFIPVQWFSYYVKSIPQIIDGTVHLPISALELDRLFHTYVLGGRDFYPLFWGRYIVALFSVGNVILVYILGKQLFNKNVGLVSAFFLAVNFRQILNSHIGIPDIYNAFFLLLSCVMAVFIWKNPTKRNYLLAGIVGGLSFSMKYQIFAFLAIFLGHLYASIESRRFLRIFFSKNIFILAFAAVIAFLISNPYFFIHFESAKMWVESVSQRYGMGANMINLFPVSYLYHYDYGAPESLLIAIGLLFTLIKYPRKSILLLAPLVPFLVVLLYLSRGGFYVRNFVTITPILLIFPAVLLINLYSYLGNKVHKIISLAIILGVLSLVTFIPIRNSIIHTYYYTKPWDYPLLSEWLYKNIPDGTVVAANPFDPPTGSPILKKTEFEIGGSYALAEHRDDGAEYALSNSDWTANPFFFWMGYGPSELSVFWNKPIDILRNTFYGLAIEEHFRYNVFSATKVWQAPDESLVLAKLPVWPKVEYKNIANFTFDKDLENWTVYGKEKKSSADYVFDSSVGYLSKGSISFIPAGTKYSIIRATSQPISIEAGHLYRVNGFLKSEKILTSRERSGFIRVDFYKDSDFEKVGLISSVSSRVYGTNNWIKKEIIERAPEDATHMTVSFQISDTATSKIWLDSVSIDESLSKIEDITMKAPYTRKKIDLDLLYTNSHANL